VQADRKVMFQHRPRDERVSEDVKLAPGGPSDARQPRAVIDIQEPHEAAWSLKGADPSLKITLIGGSSHDLLEDGAGDLTHRHLKSSNDLFERAFADMLTVN
jgi:hypothetical protein